MKKIRTLQDAVSNENKEIAMSLLNELYNDLRDFSQCIDVTYNDEILVVKKNDLGRTDQYVYNCKQKIREWVGGH